MNILNRLKRRAAKFIPPSYGYFGNYKTFDEVSQITKGYDSENILEKVKKALLKVKNGEAVYERDSVNFDEIQYAYPLLTHLLLVALKSENSLNLIDFGGSLGSSYYQNKPSLEDLVSISWNIVEQENFVAEGKKHFENEELKFFYNIDECLNSNSSVNTLLVSSSLQYLDDPYAFLDKFLEKDFEYIIFDRTTFNNHPNEDRVCLQVVPPVIYDATYPCWFFGQKKFFDKFSEKYRLVRSWEALGGTPLIHHDSRVEEAKEIGFFFEKISH